MAQRKTFPKRLFFARKEMGSTQKELGISIGVAAHLASARINRYESGIRYPDEETLEKIAKATSTPVSFFCESDDLLAEIIWHFGKMDAHQREGYIDRLKGEKI